MRKTIILILFLMMAVSVNAASKIGLSVGDMSEDFKADTTKGQTIQLSEVYSQNPVVLIFYRGGWCHYCNIQLQDYQKNIDKFTALGATVIAVSVDTPENAEKTGSEKQLDFHVVSNPEADLLSMYNVVYHVPKKLSEKYKKEYQIDLNAASGRRDRLIAIPATYVINTKGEITYAFVDEDYRKRPKIDKVIKAVEALKSPNVVF